MKRYLYAAIVIVLFTLSATALASTLVVSPSPTGPAPISPGGLVQSGYRLGFLLAGLSAFGMLIFAGAIAGTSAGNPSRITAAKQRGFAVVSALALLFFGFILLSTVDPKLVTVGIPENLLTPLPPPDPTGIETDEDIAICGGPQGPGICANIGQNCSLCTLRTTTEIFQIWACAFPGERLPTGYQCP